MLPRGTGHFGNREGYHTMFSLLKTDDLRATLQRELLPFCVALLVAQMFFKWGSFSLELVGFLALWFVLGLIADRVMQVLRR
jgi:hypothetical protein